MILNKPKRNVFVKLPFLGSTSFQIQNKLQKLFGDKLTSCNLKIVVFFLFLFFYSLFKVDITNIVVILLIYNILIQID